MKVSSLVKSEMLLSIPNDFSCKSFEGASLKPIKVHNLNSDLKEIEPIKVEILPNEKIYKELSPTPEYVMPYIGLWCNKFEDLSKYFRYRHMLELPDDGMSLTNKDLTFSFWFNVPQINNIKKKFMTFLQGHIGIGGLFVVARNSMFGAFDEYTGEFKSFGASVLDLREGWNHCFYIIQAYGTKYCKVNLLLNNKLYADGIEIILKSDLKYIGNTRDLNEPFFEFRDFRLFDRILSFAEFTFLSRLERVVPINENDDRVSFFEVINEVFEEFKELVAPMISSIFDLILICPGSNYISSVEILTLLCRNEKFREEMKKSEFFKLFPLFSNDMDHSLRRSKSLGTLLLALC